MTTVGSLCSGYGGLDLAVAQHYGGDVAWHVEYDTAPSRVLDARFPGVPNYGDVTTTDWSTVEPVDVLTAGYPCQPFSHAGKRKGSKDERHLWPHVARAISDLGPRVVVLENVRGHVSLGLDAVLGDLADLGYDTRWGVVRASDAGAPHGRARVFVVATDTSNLGRERSRDARRRGNGSPNHGLTPADTSGERHGRGQDSRSLGRLDGDDAGQARQRQRPRAVAEHRGAETPADAGSDGQLSSSETRMAGEWNAYAPAIHRWERVLGRPAPAPTEAGRTGPRLSPRFVEWMMGLPEGWVTDVEGVNRNAQLKLLGNGVVPQQALLALSALAPLARAA